MPVRTGSDPLVIDRSFDFGNLLSLHMLDTRVIARDRQLDYANFATTAGFNATALTQALGDPARQLLGTAQLQRLQDRMTRSAATWQILGQQVLMGRMNIPAPILFEALQPGTGVTVAQYGAIATKAATAPATLTATEQALLAQPAIPYNLDAWDGYASERERVFGVATALNKNLVVLAGDTHNAWASDLLDRNGVRVGVEFACSSVSSPGFETVFPNENPATLAASLTQLIGPLAYCDTSRRGFLLVTADATQCRADWVFVNTIATRSYQATTGQSLRMLPGASGRRVTAA
jgi:alkaline phosphatase D